jgi:CRP/FNR family transcriptional regulator, cyclic AMP receptor protein
MKKNREISGPLTRQMSKGDIVCAAGEHDSSLYIIHSGKLLVFVNDGTKVTPLAYLNAGEYLGELSFFDGQPRSAHVICVEDTTLIEIPISELPKQFPSWLITMAKSITRKLRDSSELIRQKGIRKKNVETIKPLSIEQQRDYFQALSHYLEDNPVAQI